MMGVNKQPRRILLTILVNLGDVVLFTAAAAALKKAWPEAKLSVLVRKAAREVVENNPLFDEVIIADYKSGKSGKAEMFRFAASLRRKQYDMAICFDQKLRSLLYMFLARIPVRVAADGIFCNLPLFRRMLATKVIRTRLNGQLDHGVLNFLDIVSQLTGKEADGEVSIGVANAADREVVDMLLKSLPQGSRKIALCVKGTFPLKDWPPERFAGLIRNIESECNVSCYVIGAPGDKQYADQVIALSGSDCRNFCGQTSVVQMAELLRRSDLLISVCTGTVHVASATGVPAVVIYGCTVPRRWHPLQEEYIPVWSMRKCSPCSKKPEQCPEKYCLHEITMNDALSAVKALLGCKEAECAR